MLKTGLSFIVVPILILFLSMSAWAGGDQSGWQPKVVSVMDKGKLETIYRDPYVVGDKDEEVAVWPLYKQEVTGLNLAGYIYESIEFSSIPGFMGVPYNVLVVLGLKGEFLDARVLYHREPMFIEGYGEKPMHDFVAQYSGLSLMQNIKFSDKQGQKKNNDSKNIYLDGLTGATASIRVLNQTLFSSALKVARAKLGFGGGKDPDLIAKIDQDIFVKMSWQELVEAGLIHKAVFSNQDVESLFVGSRNEGKDRVAIQYPKQSFIELYVMDLAIPTVGRNLLTDESWAFLQENLEPGDHAILAVSQGRYSFRDIDFLRGGISDRLLLRQEGLPIEMRDLDLNDRLDMLNPEYKINLPEELSAAEWMVYRVIGTAGLDIALTLDFDLSVVRDETKTYMASDPRSLEFSYQVPSSYYFEPDPNNKTWKSIWTDRLWEVCTLSIGVLTLFIILMKPNWVTRYPVAFYVFRTGFLLFTLFFIGFYAQGQLSIVNITGAIQSLFAGGNLNFFLYDPMTTLLWLFIGFSFFIWGRGTFCGWLCPFGALQELVSKAFTVLKIKQLNPTDRWDARFKKAKYLILAMIIAVAFFSPVWTDRLVEIEPFKTSITFYFERSWPFVLWAVGMVLLSSVVYKGYCRYLCPLGAAMAVLGRVRIFNWLPRRDECGSPCQLCKHRCEYEAIEKEGTIDYNECFQCLECVVIHDSDEMCVPLIIDKRGGRKLKKNDKADLIASC